MKVCKPVSIAVAMAAVVLSQEHLADEVAARNIVAGLDDGVALIELATRMLSLPMVANHLRHIRPAWFKPESTRPVEVQFRLATMLLREEQNEFYEQCIAPVGCGHAFLKGVALADQFYDNPNIRFARDIDVLVGSHAVTDLVTLARTRGYNILDTVNPSNFLTNELDIRAALRYQRVVNLISPNGRCIEVHSELDKGQGIFDERRMLFASRRFASVDRSLVALDPIEHFIYVAYHCARHNWSRLHWVADLAAMARSPLINQRNLMLRAEQMGLKALIEETLGFVALSANPGAADSNAKGSRILTRVLDVLQNGDKRAMEFSNAQVSTALPFPDMLAPWLRRKVKLCRLLNRMKPHISDYHSWPLPDRWQWLYCVTGPTRRTLRKRQS